MTGETLEEEQTSDVFICAVSVCNMHRFWFRTKSSWIFFPRSLYWAVNSIPSTIHPVDVAWWKTTIVGQRSSHADSIIPDWSLGWSMFIVWICFEQLELSWTHALQRIHNNTLTVLEYFFQSEGLCQQWERSPLGRCAPSLHWLCRWMFPWCWGTSFPRAENHSPPYGTDKNISYIYVMWVVLWEDSYTKCRISPLL